MKENIRLEIRTKDTIGITLKILEKLYEMNIDLRAAEVFSKKVCIKIDEISKERLQRLIEKIFEIKEVLSVDEVELLSYEKNERKLIAIIDAVDEGILAVNKDYKVEIFNRYCETLFKYNKDEVIGSDIRAIINKDAPMFKLFKDGIPYDNVEQIVDRGDFKIHYLTSGRPVLDDLGNTIGAVASIKDINKAMQLVEVVNTIKDGAFSDIIGKSNKIEYVKRIVSSVAKTTSTVLLLGESGTGKELFAKAIHRLSSRANNKFIAINCATLPENLLESELFGYEEGTFTGALKGGKNGIFEEADGGTLFLDEIGEMPLKLQAKILRVLQDGVVRRIGSSKETKVDVRIIAATNRNIEDMVKNGEFREDLYYRLSVMPIYLPPLRERKEDIPLLVNYFVENLNKKFNSKIKRIDKGYIEELMKYSWPGNIRELQNVVERSIILCEGDTLIKDNIYINTDKFIQNNIIDISEEERTLEEIVSECEREVIKRALIKYKSYREVAKHLGVSHTTIMNKIKKYKLYL
ncbi:MULTISPECIES: sigma 54-interacting transcriptional regulator [Caloramator]|uniref:HTH-type transcriptional regulatory protein TyrR n=1 Tax=Caloramator proteoclasticus DSM 10124 TaxID=1121262 RepID=A0A1M4UWP3_9CLOT|nr:MULTISPECIES: sigma 54-interacting transcriptional regulator [Caloramator]SHE61102.1 transcriptional regulator of aroF, aroG, tyrA and aromatic amino acid transport [Caloramator proteoclasticus DSM 10124]